ncbi:glutamate--cysteine ligase [Aliikangiella maris]|uniref:Glutamate--cysteine ligase n=2 Tax=Aliikangiella maris TaxID=3162458 RepID=A0ABV3MRQ0_9GAMM
MQPLEIPDFSIVQSLAEHLPGIKRGIEKESLRITPQGRLSPKAHPVELGATLTNPHITTDYSEALPEFITKATAERTRPIEELTEIHQFTHQFLQDELLWPLSMPCSMGEEKDIPIARYGRSNSGQMKEIYRIGLGYRYGRFMQTIAGVHYNFSLPDSFWQALYQQQNSQQANTLDFQTFVSEKYMGLIRNYLRYSWLIPLFYGASPALCESFLKVRNIDLDVLSPGTRYGRHATSLRMSDLGYQNKAQSRLNISYNSLAEYIQGLESAISTPDPYYAEIGVKKDGEYIQLSDKILQIENEFYSSIRPKRVTQSGERPTKALKRRGVEYIEVRALDLNPFSPVGVTQSQIALIDTFLVACLFSNSPGINLRETAEYQDNFSRVVRQGRHPDLNLMLNNHCISLQEFAGNLLNQLKPVAQLLDEVYQVNDHQSEVNRLTHQLSDLNSTFSGRIVNQIEKREDSFFGYAMEISREHKKYFAQNQLTPDKLKQYQQEAQLSHTRKSEIEDGDTLSFEEFLASYYR